MIERIWTAYTFELAKAFRSKGTYFGPLLVLLVVLVMPFQHELVRDGVSDYGFIASATQLAAGVVGFLLILLFSASLVAGELGSGTIRMVLVRPLLRHEFLLAKFFVGITYALLLDLVATLSSWVLAAFFGELSGVSYGGEVIYTSSELASTYAIAFLIALLPQIAAVAFGLMLSVLARSAYAATASAVGIWFVAGVAKNPLGISAFLFDSYVEAPWRVFADRTVALDSSWFPDAYFAIGTSLITTVVCFSIATVALARRNLHK